jgi:hypothetical protein
VIVAGALLIVAVGIVGGVSLAKYLVGDHSYDPLARAGGLKEAK